MNGTNGIRDESKDLVPLLIQPAMDMEKLQNGLNHVLCEGVKSLQDVFEITKNIPVHSTDDRVKTFNALVGFGRYIETCKLNSSSGDEDVKFPGDLKINVEEDN